MLAVSIEMKNMMNMLMKKKYHKKLLTLEPLIRFFFALGLIIELILLNTYN